MKKIFALCCAVLVLLPTFALAADLGTNTRTVFISKDDVVTGDFHDAGTNVEVEGRVEGDIMSAGQILNFSGTTNGDVLAAGANITFSGKTEQSLRLVGAYIMASGEVARNFTVIGANINLAEQAVIQKNAYIFGGNLVIRGDIKGNLTIAGENVTLSGKVAKNTTIYSNNIILENGAKLEGDLVYYSDRPAQINSGAVISGTITQKPFIAQYQPKPVSPAARLLFILLKLAGALLVAFVCWKLFPATVASILGQTTNGAWKNIGRGLIAVIATPIAIIIAMITVIGFPLAFITLGIYLIGLYLAKIAGAVLIGRWLGGLIKFNDAPDSFPWFSFLLGYLLLTLVFFIPFFGLFICLLVVFWGAGVLLKTFWK